jgi:hypothetical protein
LIDFEIALGSWDGRAEPDREGGSRAECFLRWASAQESSALGRRWVQGVGAATLLMVLAAALLGVGAVWGTLDRATSGVNVVWLLAATLVLPWLMLLAGVGVWAVRGWIPAVGWIGMMVERLALRGLSDSSRAMLDRIRRSDELGAVLAWHLAARTQAMAVGFHAGAVLGLGAMVLFKSVGFFWESTTEAALRDGLEAFVRVASMPWRGWMPEAVPEIAATESTAAWMEAGGGWWRFLLMALVFWGVVPRILLCLALGWRKRRCLAGLKFHAPQHRKLWRELTMVRRGESLKAPVDGALVVTVGGVEPDREQLRPFLLRRLRMNPTAWEMLGVLDADREDAAREALDMAPAGIVLFAEGWSLAPRQMQRALDETRDRAGDRRRVLVVGNPGDGGIEPATAEERTQWERFVDERRDDDVELMFFEQS